jgi:hypothetical protein
MITLSYSKTTYQNNKYPIQSIIDSDTVIIISPEQVKKINKDIILLESLQKKDSLWVITYNNKEKIIVDLQGNIKQLQELNLINDSIIKAQDSSILIQKEKYDVITNSFKQENLLLKKEIKKSAIKITLFSVAILVGLLLTK